MTRDATDLALHGDILGLSSTSAVAYDSAGPGFSCSTKLCTSTCVPVLCIYTWKCESDYCQKPGRDRFYRAHLLTLTSYQCGC